MGVKKRRAFKDMFKMQKVYTKKAFETPLNKHNAENDPQYKEAIKLLEEAADIVDQVDFFGGIESLKKYAAKGMEVEQPDIFSKAVVS